MQSDKLEQRGLETIMVIESQLDSNAHSQITSEKQLSGKLKEKEEICTALQQKVRVKVVNAVNSLSVGDSDAHAYPFADSGVGAKTWTAAAIRL